MNLKKLSIFFGLVFVFSACKENRYATAEILGKRIPIDKTIKADIAIEKFITPYKKHLNKTLDSSLVYNPKTIDKTQGKLNTAIGNLMADIVIQQAGPVFQNRSGNRIDMVLLNHGGIRAGLDKGQLSTRDAYALMPFENEIVVAELSGKKIQEMLRYLEKAKTAHPVSGIQIEMDNNYKVIKATINKKPIDINKNYFVATSDYLQQGGDNMSFFIDPVNLYQTNYKLRNAIIDYFKTTDTIKSHIDQRFIKKP